MSENCQGSVGCSFEDLRQALSIHTRKITDSCRDKDCIEDLRVYLTRSSQTVLDGAAGAKVRSGELIYAYIDVEPIAFDRNHYCIDVTFYYRILADGVVGNARPVALYGLAVFSKRAVLCGEDSKAHIYSSNTSLLSPDLMSRYHAANPTAVVEVLDPMVLNSKVRETGQGCAEPIVPQIPEYVLSQFDEELVLSGESRRLLVTLGQFSVIRLERDAQLVVPVLEYSLPNKECSDSECGCAEDPCEVFSRIPFPVQQFAPQGCDGRDDCGYTTTAKG